MKNLFFFWPFLVTHLSVHRTVRAAQFFPRAFVLAQSSTNHLTKKFHKTSSFAWSSDILWTRIPQGLTQAQLNWVVNFEKTMILFSYLVEGHIDVNQVLQILTLNSHSKLLVFDCMSVIICSKISLDGSNG